MKPVASLTRLHNYFRQTLSEFYLFNLEESCYLTCVCLNINTAESRI